MPDQPNDTPSQPDADEPTTEINPTTEATPTPESATGVSGPAASEPKQSWAAKPLHLTRAVVIGTAAGVLLVGGVFGFAIGATLAGDDAHGPGRGGIWHRDGGDRGGMPGPGWPGDMGDQGPHWHFGPDGGQDGYGEPPGWPESPPESTSPDDSDSGT